MAALRSRRAVAGVLQVRDHFTRRWQVEKRTRSASAIKPMVILQHIGVTFNGKSFPCEKLPPDIRLV
jgi:hypothetical protein